jgi:hypothetical protein
VGTPELTDVIDGYLAALTANDPSKLPLADGVRVTENGHPIELGHGLFETAVELSYRHVVADPVAGQVMAFTVVREGPLLANVAIRLAVAGDAITEIETVVARKGGSSVARPDKLTEPDPRFGERLDDGDRPGRDRLIAVADSYFEGIEGDTADGVPFHPECDRIENGQHTTNSGPFALSAREQFERKVFAYITRVRGRRYPIVDEGQGLVVALVSMDVPGRRESFASFPIPLAQVPQRMFTPRTILLAELFKVRNGQIRAIEATMVNVTLGAASGW